MERGKEEEEEEEEEEGSGKAREVSGARGVREKMRKTVLCKSRKMSRCKNLL